MLGWFLKGERAFLRLTAIPVAIAGLVAFWQIFDPPNKPPNGPTVTACDGPAAPLAQKLTGSLAQLDCKLPQIRICDIQESAVAASDTSHGMAAHKMQISVEAGGARFAVIGNGRGAQAAQSAFDNLFNNLVISLKDKDLCS